MKVDNRTIRKEIVQDLQKRIERIHRLETDKAALEGIREDARRKRRNTGNLNERLRSLYEAISTERSDFYTPVIAELFGGHYEAIYWSPASAPFCDGMHDMRFSRFGRWTLVDITDLRKERSAFSCFSSYTTLRWDITDVPNFPEGIRPGSFDLSFFNKEWAGDGATYSASHLALKPDGIVMTNSRNIGRLNNAGYSLILCPENSLLPYALLRKQA